MAEQQGRLPSAAASAEDRVNEAPVVTETAAPAPESSQEERDWALINKSLDDSLHLRREQIDPAQDAERIAALTRLGFTSLAQEMKRNRNFLRDGSTNPFGINTYSNGRLTGANRIWAIEVIINATPEEWFGRAQNIADLVNLYPDAVDFVRFLGNEESQWKPYMEQVSALHTAVRGNQHVWNANDQHVWNAIVSVANRQDIEVLGELNGIQWFHNAISALLKESKKLNPALSPVSAQIKAALIQDKYDEAIQINLINGIPGVRNFNLRWAENWWAPYIRAANTIFHKSTSETDIAAVIATLSSSPHAEIDSLVTKLKDLNAADFAKIALPIANGTIPKDTELERRYLSLAKSLFHKNLRGYQTGFYEMERMPAILTNVANENLPLDTFVTSLQQLTAMTPQNRTDIAESFSNRSIPPENWISVARMLNTFGPLHKNDLTAIQRMTPVNNTNDFADVVAALSPKIKRENRFAVAEFLSNNTSGNAGIVQMVNSLIPANTQDYNPTTILETLQSFSENNSRNNWVKAVNQLSQKIEPQNRLTIAQALINQPEEFAEKINTLENNLDKSIDSKMRTQIVLGLIKNNNLTAVEKRELLTSVLSWFTSVPSDFVGVLNKILVPYQPGLYDVNRVLSLAGKIRNLGENQTKFEDALKKISSRVKGPNRLDIAQALLEKPAERWDTLVKKITALTPEIEEDMRSQIALKLITEPDFDIASAGSSAPTDPFITVLNSILAPYQPGLYEVETLMPLALKVAKWQDDDVKKKFAEALKEIGSHIQGRNRIEIAEALIAQAQPNQWKMHIKSINKLSAEAVGFAKIFQHVPTSQWKIYVDMFNDFTKHGQSHIDEIVEMTHRFVQEDKERIDLFMRHAEDGIQELLNRNRESAAATPTRSTPLGREDTDEAGGRAARPDDGTHAGPHRRRNESSGSPRRNSLGGSSHGIDDNRVGAQ